MAAAGRFREVLAKILKEIIVISQVPGPGGSLLDILLGGLGGLFGAGGGRAATAGASIPGGIGGFAKGAAVAPGGVMARNIKRYAKGGIVDSPEAFAFARGLGVIGEAGPEAVLPLARVSSGELGVKAVRDHRAGDYARQLGAAES